MPVFKDGAFNAKDVGRALDGVLPEIDAEYILDDNYRPHRVCDVKQLAEDYGVEHLEPPARSPDINFAELVFAFLSHKLYAGGKTYVNKNEL